MLELLRKLIETPSPSGGEEKSAEILTEFVKPFADEVFVDSLGNLIVHRKGDGERLMLAAHRDEIGVLVTFIDEKGFLRFEVLGGVYPEWLTGVKVVFPNGVVGAVCHENKVKLKDLKRGKLFIDIGARDKAEAEKLVQVGDKAVVQGSLDVLGDRLCGKSLDNKAGCAVLAETLRRVKQPKNDLWAVFTVQEELGLRGAKTSAFAVEPVYAVAIDVTDTGDTPECEPMAVTLGEGPAVKLCDKSVLCDRTVVQWLFDAAKAAGVPAQREVLEYGGTDAGAIQLIRGGAFVGGLSLPTRYIHSPVEMISKSDMEGAVRLLVQAVETGIGQ